MAPKQSWDMGFFTNLFKKQNMELYNRLTVEFRDQAKTSVKSSDSADDIRLTDHYKEYRSVFELKNFKLNNPVRYGEIVFDKKKGKSLILRSESDFITCNRDVKGMPIYEIKVGNNSAKKHFYELWLDDPEKVKFSSIKFDPTEVNEEDLEEGEYPAYNTFSGFVNDKGAEPIREEESAFIDLLRWLLVDDRVFEYFKCWLAHIIQKPNIKTKISPILFSQTHGTGKNSVVDGCRFIIGTALCATVNDIEDVTKNFNSHLCNRLLIYGDEINANAKKVADKLKAVITRPTCNLEKKGVDAIEIDDFTNWIFTSNNENNIKIEKGDRRFLMIRCKETAQSAMSRLSYEEIQNPEKAAQLFAFFKTYKQSPESIAKYGEFSIGSASVIETAYKTQMEFENLPAYIQFLYKATGDFYNSSGDFVCLKYSSARLYEIVKEWAKKHHMSSNFTIQEFTKQSKLYIDRYKRKKNTGNVYEFPSKKAETIVPSSSSL